MLSFIFITQDVCAAWWISYAEYLVFCICFSPYRLEGTEEKFRNRESRPEDLQIIAELKNMVSEREALVKKLVVGNCW